MGFRRCNQGADDGDSGYKRDAELDRNATEHRCEPLGNVRAAGMGELDDGRDCDRRTVCEADQLKVLFTGRGTSGSWQIRGAQMSIALNGCALPMASAAECKTADVIVAVKRVPDALLANIRKSGKPWAWDIVDAYPQPACETWDKARSLEWLHGEVKRLQPDHIIWPNAQMRGDFGGGTTIYHHHRPGLLVNPIRQGVRVIGYEGSVKCLSGWESQIEAACKKVGARFVINPDRLCDVDAVLALRSRHGYPHHFWKSNVKLANAHGSGTPFIGQLESGYFETGCGAEAWITGPQDIPDAVQQIARPERRRAIRDQFLRVAKPIESIAEQYKAVLCALKS